LIIDELKRPILAGETTRKSGKTDNNKDKTAQAFMAISLARHVSPLFIIAGEPFIYTPVRILWQIGFFEF